ncbi:hypothetical protein ACOMHN_047712 [Nucella lapillus]
MQILVNENRGGHSNGRETTAAVGQQIDSDSNCSDGNVTPSCSSKGPWTTAPQAGDLPEEIPPAAVAGSLPERASPVAVPRSLLERISPVAVVGSLPERISPVAVVGSLPERISPVAVVGSLPERISPVAVVGSLPERISPVAVVGSLPERISPVAVVGSLPERISPVAVAGSLSRKSSPVAVARPLPERATPIPVVGSLPERTSLVAVAGSPLERISPVPFVGSLPDSASPFAVPGSHLERTSPVVVVSPLPERASPLAVNGLPPERASPISVAESLPKRASPVVGGQASRTSVTRPSVTPGQSTSPEIPTTSVVCGQERSPGGRSVGAEAARDLTGSLHRPVSASGTDGYLRCPKTPLNNNVFVLDSHLDRAFGSRRIPAAEPISRTNRTSLVTDNTRSTKESLLEKTCGETSRRSTGTKAFPPLSSEVPSFPTTSALPVHLAREKFPASSTHSNAKLLHSRKNTAKTNVASTSTFLNGGCGSETFCAKHFRSTTHNHTSASVASSSLARSASFASVSSRSALCRNPWIPIIVITSRSDTSCCAKQHSSSSAELDVGRKVESTNSVQEQGVSDTLTRNQQDQQQHTSQPSHSSSSDDNSVVPSERSPLLKHLSVGEAEYCYPYLSPLAETCESWQGNTTSRTFLQTAELLSDTAQINPTGESGNLLICSSSKSDQAFHSSIGNSSRSPDQKESHPQQVPEISENPPQVESASPQEPEQKPTETRESVEQNSQQDQQNIDPFNLTVCFSCPRKEGARVKPQHQPQSPRSELPPSTVEPTPETSSSDSSSAEENARDTFQQEFVSPSPSRHSDQQDICPDISECPPLETVPCTHKGSPALDNVSASAMAHNSSSDEISLWSVPECDSALENVATTQETTTQTAAMDEQGSDHNAIDSETGMTGSEGFDASVLCYAEVPGVPESPSTTAAAQVPMANNSNGPALDSVVAPAANSAPHDSESPSNPTSGSSRIIQDHTAGPQDRSRHPLPSKPNPQPPCAQVPLPGQPCSHQSATSRSGQEIRILTSEANETTDSSRPFQARGEQAEQGAESSPGSVQEGVPGLNPRDKAAEVRRPVQENPESSHLNVDGCNPPKHPLADVTKLVQPSNTLTVVSKAHTLRDSSSGNVSSTPPGKTSSPQASRQSSASSASQPPPSVSKKTTAPSAIHKPRKSTEPQKQSKASDPKPTLSIKGDNVFSATKGAYSQPPADKPLQEAHNDTPQDKIPTHLPIEESSAQNGSPHEETRPDLKNPNPDLPPSEKSPTSRKCGRGMEDFEDSGTEQEQEEEEEEGEEEVEEEEEGMEMVAGLLDVYQLDRCQQQNRGELRTAARKYRKKQRKMEILQKYVVHQTTELRELSRLIRQVETQGTALRAEMKNMDSELQKACDRTGFADEEQTRKHEPLIYKKYCAAKTSAEAKTLIGTIRNRQKALHVLEAMTYRKLVALQHNFKVCPQEVTKALVCAMSEKADN